MLLLSISYEGYISIIATLMGLCAVFLTITPLVSDRRYRTLKNELKAEVSKELKEEYEQRLNKLEKKIADLECDLAPFIQQIKESRKRLQNALKTKVQQ